MAKKIQGQVFKFVWITNATAKQKAEHITNCHLKQKNN